MLLESMCGVAVHAVSFLFLNHDVPYICNRNVNVTVFLVYEECGVPANRIVGGQVASIRDYPWTVGLTRGGRPYCGGSLINSVIQHAILI